MEKKTDNNMLQESVNVSKNVTNAAAWVENLHRFFDKEDQHGIYLQNPDGVFAKLTSAIQGMIGCEAYWNIVDKTAE